MVTNYDIRRGTEYTLRERMRGGMIATVIVAALLIAIVLMLLNLWNQIIDAISNAARAVMGIF